MDRGNHYEAAFEAYLQERRLCYVAVDETRRAVLGEMSIKSLDFIVFGDRRRPAPGGREGPALPDGTAGAAAARLGVLVHPRGRGRPGALGRTLSGRGYRGLLVFVYHVLPSVELPDDVEDLWTWRGRRYLMRAVPSADYRLSHARPQPQMGHRDAAARRFPLPGPAVAPLHPPSVRPRRRMSGAVMNRLKIGVRLESLGLPLRRACSRPSRLGVAGVRVDAAGDLSPNAPVGDRPARVPPSSALPQPGIDRAGLSAAPRPRRRGGPAAAHRARPQGDDAQLRPRPARGDRGGRRVPGEGEEARGRLLDESLTALAAHGDRVGAVLALETGLESGAALNAYLARFDSGSLAANLDPANLLTHGFDPVRIGPRPRTAGSCCVTAQDARAGRRQPHRSGSAAGRTATSTGCNSWACWRKSSTAAG